MSHVTVKGRCLIFSMVSSSDSANGYKAKRFKLLGITYLVAKIELILSYIFYGPLAE